MTALLDEFAWALLVRASEGLPDDVIHETRRTFLNVLGTSIGASRTVEADALCGALVARGASEVVPPGRSQALDRYGAALAIGFAAHYDDYDDTHLETVIHPGAATLGALYPLALLRGSSPGGCLVAFALGVESQLRLGMAISPSHYDAGWHITGTCGVVGAAVATSILRGFDEERLASAIACALNFTVGHREAFGTGVKPFHSGKAASNGLLASELAERLGPIDETILERERGFFAVFADAVDDSWLRTASIESDYVLLANTYKPFPCGIVAHPAIEAAIELHGRLDPAAIAGCRTITVHCNALVPELMGRTEVATGLEARFCVLHGVSVGLLFGRAGIAEFSDERAVDAAVVALRSRARLEADEACPRNVATVTLELADDRSESMYVPIAAGSLERPMSDEQLLAKFTAQVEPLLPDKATAIAECVMSLGEGASVRDLSRVLRS